MNMLDRNRLVTFEAGTSTEDDYGETVTAWNEITKAWARADFGSGRELREAAQEAAFQPATFIVEWSPTLAGINVRDRILFDGGAWDITAIKLGGLNKEIHFTATRGL